MNKQTLFHKAKGGEVRVWSVWVEDDSVVTEYGVLNGQMQLSKKRCEPKNVGRSNATTPQSQAVFEAEAMYKNRLERKYSATIEEAQEQLLLPMLAHKYEPKKHKADTIWLAQPKFDGTRCMAYWEGDSVRLISRQGKDYTISHVQKHLETFLPRDSIFDGELYVHGLPLQTVVSLVKKYKLPESLQVEYHVYDAPQVQGDDSLSFVKRALHYSFLVGEAAEGPVKLVESEDIDDTPEAISRFHQRCLEDGYEGAILRHPSGIYQWGYRSHDLLKVKSFQDAEFEVVGYRDGRGKMEGKIIFECKNDQSEATFEVVPKATMEERAKMYEEGDSYVGRNYTVQFFDRSTDLIPRFPVGIAFQEDR